MVIKETSYTITIFILVVGTIIQIGLYLSSLSLSQALPHEHQGLLLLILLNLLAIVNQLDLRVRSWLQTSDTPIALDQAGLKIINEQANLGIRLVHDQDLSPQIIELGELSTEHSQDVRSILTKPTQYEDRLSTELQPCDRQKVLSLEEFAECRVLAHLPEINGRLQVGLFATQEIPKDAIFLWRSDIAIISQNSIALLGLSERINQRPLTRGGHAVALQSGGKTLRSNPITLINFAWCHTDSVDAQSSPYRLLPPHDLGDANCHFASVHTKLQANLNLCSAIISHKSIPIGTQLLAFSGSGRNGWVVFARRFLSKSISLVTPALMLWPWLRLYQSLS